MSELKLADLEIQNETLRRRVLDLESKILQAETQAERATVEGYLKVAAVEAGIVPGAVPDVVSRAMRTGEWKINSQGRLFRQQDGQPDVDLQGEYVTPQKWFGTLKAETPFYFTEFQEKQNSGGMYKEEMPNPWSKEHWNLTKQGRICSVSLEEAKKMADAAGSPLFATKPPAK